METVQKPFSDTLRILLHFAKRHDGEFNIDTLRGCLGPHYHPTMKLKDILIVMDNAFREMLDIKEFESGKRPTIYIEIIMSPFDGIFPLGESILFGPRLEDKFTIEEFYNKIISNYMHKFMMTNIGWCRDYVFPEEKDKVE